MRFWNALCVPQVGFGLVRLTDHSDKVNTFTFWIPRISKIVPGVQSFTKVRLKYKMGHTYVSKYSVFKSLCNYFL